MRRATGEVWGGGTGTIIRGDSFRIFWGWIIHKCRLNFLIIPTNGVFFLSLHCYSTGVQPRRYD